MIACVGGGSNAIGFFFDFLDEKDVRLVGVEAGGRSKRESMLHDLAEESLVCYKAVKHGFSKNSDGQINPTHSVSQDLITQQLGQVTCFYKDSGRIEYGNASDAQAMKAFKSLASEEGILPALETSHGLAFAMERAAQMEKDQTICLNLSGRGDKDAMEAARIMGVSGLPKMSLDEKYDWLWPSHSEN